MFELNEGPKPEPEVAITNFQKMANLGIGNRDSRIQRGKASSGGNTLHDPCGVHHDRLRCTT